MPGQCLAEKEMYRKGMRVFSFGMASFAKLDIQMIMERHQNATSKRSKSAHAAER